MPSLAYTPGTAFNYWVLIGKDRTDPEKRNKWKARCFCGEVRSVSAAHLRTGASKSCGCQIVKGNKSNRFKHGLSETPEFKIWLGIKTRCTNPKTKGWEHYGGKGISVCEDWNSDFTSFLSDMGPRPSPKHSIERENLSLGYSPDNCRWATPKEQARNTSRTRWVEYEGQIVSLAEACERSGVNYASANERVNLGRDWKGTKWLSK